MRSDVARRHGTFLGMLASRVRAVTVSMPALIFVLLLVTGTTIAQSRDASGARAMAPAYSARVINPKLTGGMYEPTSRTMLIWGTDGTVLRSADATTWTHASTPIAADLEQIAADRQGKVLIGVGAHGAIIRSEDSGRHWTTASTPTANVDLRAIVHHEPSGAWLAAGTRGALLRSTDAGKSWLPLDSGFTLAFEALWVEPVTGSILLGGEEGIVGRSTDAGQRWTLIHLSMPAPVTPVTAFHAYRGQVLATSALGRLLVSSDAGKSWNLVNVGANAYFTDGAFDPTHDSMVFTSHTGDVFLHHGVTDVWERIEVTLEGRKNYLSAVRYDSASKSLFAAGHDGTLARSGDGGHRWQKIEVGSATSLESLLYAGPGRLVAFGDGGFILSSSDSGRSWRRIAPDLSVNLRELAIAAGDVIVASGELGSVLRSVDNGATWEVVDVAYPDHNTPPNLRSLIVEPREGALIAAGAPGTIIRSAKDGARWDIPHWTPLEAEEAFPWILVDAKEQLLVVVEARGSTYVSKDSGRTWRQSKIHTAREFWHGVVLQSKGILLLAGARGVAARSDDAASTWKTIDTGVTEDLFGSYADEASGNLFLMGANGLILHSTDAGITWRRRSSGVEHSLRRMLRAPRSAVLVSFGEHGAISCSEDGGVTWRAVASGTDAELRKGLIEPGSGNLILVGQQGVILRSKNLGRDWELLPSHTLRHFRSAVFNPRNGDLFLVGERLVRLSRSPAPTSSDVQDPGHPPD